MIADLLIIAGFGVLTVALRTLIHPLAHKLSLASLLVTSFLAGYLPTGSIWVGVLCAASWLFLPWIELLTRVRKTELPGKADFKEQLCPPSESLPLLHELAGTFEASGFEQVSDAGWQKSSQTHFFRLLYHPAKKFQAAICLMQQGGLTVTYLMITTRHQSGTLRTTWSYPFSGSLKTHPQTKVNHVSAEENAGDMVVAHELFLAAGNTQSDDLILAVDPEQLPQLLQEDFSRQISHNLELGLLRRSANGIHYTWRGLLFLWFQFLRDLVKL